jgi:Mrp family chromosome partitioning ATPase
MANDKKMEFLTALAFVRPELSASLTQEMHMATDKPVRIISTIPIFSNQNALSSMESMSPQVIFVDAGVAGYNLPGVRELRKLSKKPVVVVGFAEAGSSDREDMLGANLDAVYALPLSSNTFTQIFDDLPEKYEQVTSGWKKGAWSDVLPDDIRDAAARSGGSAWERACIAVWSPKGGVGKTTVAIELAAALATLGGRNVALVDANMNGGHVSLRLDVKTNNNILTLATNFSMSNGNELLQKDMNSKIRECMIPVKGAPNLHLLSGIMNMDQARNQHLAGQAGIDFMHYVLSYLKRTYDFVIVDMGSSTNVGVHIGALEEAGTVLVVVTPDLTGIADVKYGVHKSIVPSIGLDISRFGLVINQWQDNLGIDPSQAATFAGISSVGVIPLSVGGAVTRAGNDGVSFVARYAGQSSNQSDIEHTLSGFVHLAASFYAPIATVWEARSNKGKKAKGLFGLGKKVK